jgi:LPXTG-motif cell wall-anchored protein
MKGSAFMFMMMGAAFFAIGLSTSQTVFTVLGIAFLAVGLSAKRKKKE